jgi:Kef-type K+ transport system membrane component KefB
VHTLPPLAQLLFQTAVIIGAGRLAGRLARRVRQPAVIAEIAAGILLGPTVFGALAPSASAMLFPPGSLSHLQVVGDLGLVFFMFVVGLEIDPRLVRGQGRAALWISQVGMLATFGLGAVVAFNLHAAWAPEGVPVSTFALFLGVAMSVTAFPVLARILTELRLARTPIGALALASAAAADVTAWCVLAFVVSYVRADGLISAVFTTVAALVFLGLMVTLVRPRLARFAEVSPDGVSPDAIAICLVMLMLSAVTTELIGVHALFGAFVFGAIMPRDAGLTLALGHRIEDFVTAALLPLFFASSGLKTDLGLLMNADALVPTAVIVITASIGKIGATWVVARWHGLDPRSAAALGSLMNSRGLVELIVLHIGLDLGVITPAVFSMMVVMAIVTTLAATPAVAWLLEPSEAEPDQRDAELSSETTAWRVLMCAADPAIAPGMAELGVALARPSGGEVVALQLLEADRPSVYLRAEDETEELEALMSLVEHAEAAGMVPTARRFPSSDVAADICRAANNEDATLTLIGLHRPVWSRSALGGVVADVLENSDRPVGLFLDRGLRRVARVLVGTTDDHGAALRVAARLIAGGAEVDLLHLPRASAAPPSLVGAASVRMQPTDAPLDALLAAAVGYDLVVVDLGAEWDLDPNATVFHRERLVDALGVSMLAIYTPDVA